MSGSLEAVFWIRIRWVRIRIQHIKLNPIRIQGFDDKKFLNCWLKIAIYLSLGLHKGRPSYMSNLQPSKENIQHFKTWKFLTFFFFWGSFLPSWIWIYWPDWIRIQSGSGSETLPRRKGFGKILHPCLTTYLQTGGLQQVESELGRSHASQSSHYTISRF